MIDYGQGLQYLAKSGDGTKRCVLFAVLDWDRNVSIASEIGAFRPHAVIRGYDEPDTNLHYEAQHRILDTISSIATADTSNIQAIVCTHSLAMIDRAPAQSIRLLTLSQSRTTEVKKLITSGDSEVERFLSEMAREFGISNTLMFYERCILLVEGPTEINALPILYKRLYQRSLIEDGIQLIDVSENGGARALLKLLGKNKQPISVVFLDHDTNLNREAEITEETLLNSGFTQEFVASHVIYVGNQEFEDAFSNEQISSCLQQFWPRREGDWSASDVQDLRLKEGKFSTNLKILVNQERNPDATQPFRKPHFGKLIAETCQFPDLPVDVTKLFECVRSVARVGEQ